MGYRKYSRSGLSTARHERQSYGALPPPSKYNSLLVGRKIELSRLQNSLNQARAGQRSVVFVTGEPGIGKTTLIDTFTRQVAAEEPLWIIGGQCIEHYGPGEAYLPILTALDHLCHKPDRALVIDQLREHAPTWLVQLTTALNVAEREQLRRQLGHTGVQRMLREFDVFIAALSQQRPVILVLEDLQWSDHATLDLLSFLARQRKSDNLLMVGTYRPIDVLTNDHPIRAVHQELSGQGLCTEIALAGLTQSDIDAYLSQRFFQTPVPTSLAQELFRYTEGNPLFLVAMTDELIAHKLINPKEEPTPTLLSPMFSAGTVPDRMRQVITKQMDRLRAEERQLLAVASVAGLEFTTAEIAAVVGVVCDIVEQYCESLVQRQVLRPAGFCEWSDGTLTTRYGFHHAVYQYLWQERVSPRQRQQYQQRLKATTQPQNDE